MAIDDVVAAVVLLFVMMRRLEIKGATQEINASVAPADLQAWQRLALAACNLAAAACAAKAIVSLSWLQLAMRFEIGEPWFRLVPMLAFVGWTASLIVAWRWASRARLVQAGLGIVLRRQSSRS